ncbi:MAG: TlpA disulfide reductase family protein [Anaerolineae bacterium]|nr:TlpA disulfide reductase family protein [Anaerolineae bacterium]
MAALFLGLLAAVLFISAVTGRDSAANPAGPLPESGPPLQAGALPYDFTLMDVDGNAVRLSDFREQPVMINFWATWCAPCRIEMPAMQAVYEAHRDDSLVILAINQGETAAQARQFFTELGLSYSLLLDPENAVLQRYGIGSFLPSSLFIAPSGEITAIHRGPLSQKQLLQYVEQILPG